MITPMGMHTRGSPRLLIGVRPLEIMANCDLISSAGQNPGYSLARCRISEVTRRLYGVQGYAKASEAGCWMW